MISLYQPSSNPVHLAFARLQGIEIDMEIGVHPSEIGRIQKIVIDIEVGFDDALTRIPDSKDGLLDGFDYSNVKTCVDEVVKERIHLLETVANNIADRILKLRGALTCEITVTKKRCWGNVQTTSIRIQREA